MAEARRWIGTPYHHQAATRGAGCDCVGLIRGVGLALQLWDDTEWPRFAAYSRTPNPRVMGEGMRLFLAPADAPQAGDIVWLQWRAGLPMHLAFLAEYNGRQTLIHALDSHGAVTEHGFTAEWQARAASYWRFPNVE